MALFAISESTVCKNTSASQFWINSVISCLEFLLKEYDFLDIFLYLQ